MSVSLTWVDAFTDAPFAGNPAGVCLLDEALPVSTMQSLAAELGIAETAFVTPSARPGTFDLRWFSPLVEIDLCGHATLASAHVLRARRVIDGATPVTFDTRSGALRAAFDGDLIELDFPADTMSKAPSPRRWRTNGARAWSSAPAPPPSSPWWSCAAKRRCATTGPISPPSRPPATRRCSSPPPPTPDPGPTTCLRVFGPNVGIDEDPATGSAQCVVGPVLVRRPRTARTGGAPALAPGRGALRAPRGRPGAHRGECRHGVHG